jgi:predicted lipoprotein with Yx(FWY)xxD motif
MRLGLSVILVGLVAAACGSSATTTASTSPSPTAVSVVAEVTKTVKGQNEVVLTNTSAMTLYYLTSDTPTSLACQGACATFWPPLVLATGDPGSTLALPGKFTVAANANGRQVLYNGHPLYAFSKDKTTSDANGEGINAFGGTWHVATPTLAAM